jgi:4'-phosphopantetheinyl transferase
VDEPPASLRFRYGARGKPSLEGSWPHRFNLSHSGLLGLFAIARGRSLGVDVERVEEKRSLEKIAARFFSSDECAALKRLPEDQRPAGFYNAWTRKEAYIKATGEGLATPLASFSVSLAPGAAARLLQHRDDPAEVDRWSLVALDVGVGYRAALMTEGHELRVRCFEAEPLLRASEAL